MEKLTPLSFNGVLDLIFHNQIRQFNRTVFDDRSIIFCSKAASACFVLFFFNSLCFSPVLFQSVTGVADVTHKLIVNLGQFFAMISVI